MNTQTKKNMVFFGLGTIGRDMVYTIVSMFLMFYLTEIVQIGKMAGVLAAITAIIWVCRAFDAFNDPFMGTIADNTKTRWGRYKPWIALGALLSGVFTVLIFTDFGLQGAAYVALFTVCYLLWGVTFTMNDIPFWSLLPNLTSDQKEREKIGSFARICANIGLFAVVALITPITKALGDMFAKDGVPDMKLAYMVFSVALVVMLWLCQCLTLFGVKEPKEVYPRPKTTLKQMLRAIFKNDQLLWTTISMALFMIGYVTTTSFGLYFFKYDYGDEGMYSIFAVILGVSQIIALAVFPLFSKKFSRRQLFSGCIILVALGYAVFILTGYVFPMSMIFIGIAGVLLFTGQAGIQLLMLVFLTDTVEYGQWKLGQRNESVTFSLQPFINKISGAVASGVVGIVMIITSIGTAASRFEDAGSIGNPMDFVTNGDRLVMRIFMMIVPMLFIAASYIIYMFKYKIDKNKYDRIMKDLEKQKLTEQEGEAAV